MISPRAMLALIGALAILGAALGLYWKGRSAGVAAERPKVAAALESAAVSKLETEGARTSAARVEVIVRQREAAAESVAKLVPEILKSESADEALDPERSARLRRHDDELCRLANGDLIGCAPATGDADRRDESLHAAQAARSPRRE